MALSGIDRETWWPSGTGIHEVTFALNPFDEVIELYSWEGPLAPPDDWKKSFDRRRWLTGSIDWLGWRLRWWIDDLKTGAWPVDPVTSKQLKSYALVPWFIEGLPAEWACDVSITQWPRYPLGDEPVRKWHELTAWDLREHLDDVKWVLEHPDHVHVASDEEAGDKLHPCSGCPCRETFPGSEWMQSFFYRALPHCAQGMVKRVYG